jgi:hypothetical protein
MATTSIDTTGRLTDNLLIVAHSLLSLCDADFLDGQNSFSFNTNINTGTTVNSTSNKTAIPTATATADLNIGNSAKPIAKNPIKTATPLMSKVRPAVL